MSARARAMSRASRVLKAVYRCPRRFSRINYSESRPPADNGGGRLTPRGINRPLKILPVLAHHPRTEAQLRHFTGDRPLDVRHDTRELLLNGRSAGLPERPSHRRSLIQLRKIVHHGHNHETVPVATEQRLIDGKSASLQLLVRRCQIGFDVILEIGSVPGDE